MEGFVKATLNFASGATSTSAQYVGDHSRCFLVLSAMTNYNAGAGNATVNLMGSTSLNGNYCRLLSATVATHTSLGIYPMANPGIPYLKVEFATAVTGSSSQNVELLLGGNE